MKLGNERPIDAVAARVTSVGESFEYREMESSQDSEVPLPVVVPTRAQQMNPSFADMTGKRLGRMVVIGISADRKARWVCKCVCGRYAPRTSAAITAAAPDACCEQCYLMAVSKRQEYIRRTGKEKDTREFLT